DREKGGIRPNRVGHRILVEGFLHNLVVCRHENLECDTMASCGGRHAIGDSVDGGVADVGETKTAERWGGGLRGKGLADATCQRGRLHGRQSMRRKVLNAASQRWARRP